MRIRYPFAVAIVAVCLASRASALWVELQLKPNNLKQTYRAFSIQVTDKDNGMKEFVITMAGDPKRPLRAFIDGNLKLYSGKDDVGLIPVAESREDGKMMFRFRVTARALENSRFQIDESLDIVHKNADGSPQTDKQGKPKVERWMGGESFWFFLRDFAKQ